MKISDKKMSSKECPYKNFHYSIDGRDCNISDVDVICSEDMNFDYTLCYTYSEYEKNKRGNRKCLT